MDKAVARFRLRDFGGALEAFQAAVAEKPELPPAEVFMADLFGRAKLPGPQRNWLQRAVLATPADPQAYLVLGDLAVRDGRLVEADLLFSKGQGLVQAMAEGQPRKEPLQKRALFGLLAVAELKNDWDTALKHLDALGESAKEDPGLLQRRGRALFHQGKADEALECFRNARAADQDRVDPAVLMGQLYEQTGDRASATQYMTQAMEGTPDVVTRLAVARWALDAGKLDVAKEQAEAALTAAPESLDAMLTAGMVDLYAENYEEAEKHFEAVIVQAPNNFAGANGLALALCEMDDEVKRARALEYARSNARKFSNNPQAAATLGWVLYKFDRIEEADRVLGQVLKTGHMSPTTAYYVARVAVRRGQARQARALLELALKTPKYFPKRPDAQALFEQLSK